MRSLLFTTAIAAMMLAPSAYAADALTKSDVEGIIKEYLSNNPEVITDALNKAQAKQAAEAQIKAQSAIKDRAKDIFEDGKSPVAGNPKGDVTLVEFFDYHCGYCKKMLPAMAQMIQDDKKLRVVFKEYPILSPDSQLAAKAALAVYRIKPDKYFDYHTALMNFAGKFEESVVIDEAKKLGIDEAKLKKEMEGSAVADIIKTTAELAGSLNIRGTPGFIVGNTIVPGATSVEELKKMVEEARKAKKK